MATAYTQSDYDTITEALDLSELPIEEQEEILIDISDLVLKGAMVRFLEIMDDTSKTAFDALMDRGPSAEEVEAFIQQHVPDADAIVRETLEDFADDILAVTKE